MAGTGKIKAFTIMEVLITMVILSIAYTLIFQAYRYTKQLADLSSERDEETTYLIRFYNILQYDIRRCDYMKASEFGIDLFFGDETIFYQFFNDQIKRTKGFQSETFYIPYNHLGTKYLDNNNEIIHEVRFNMMPGGSHELPVSVLKMYDNAFLFGLEFD